MSEQQPRLACLPKMGFPEFSLGQEKRLRTTLALMHSSLANSLEDGLTFTIKTKADREESWKRWFQRM